jgi:hypothetical protein
MPKSYSAAEPAERPFNVALSLAEIVALANWHTAQIKRIKPRVGKIIMEEGIRGPKAMLVIKEAQAQVAAHATRARGLLSILPR